MKDRNASENAYRVILDDITEANRHFADLGELGSILQLEQGSSLIPGEDIRVYVEAYLDGENGSKVTSAACLQESARRRF